MKKNITINLFGTLYAIDEDACQLLEQYTENMRSYFSKQEGGDEIVDDIEHRIAELLWEDKEQGNEAVDIQTIKDIINKIGNPEQMSENAKAEQTAHAPESEKASTSDKQADSEQPKNNTTRRKLYRDANDKMLGGVISGFSHFIGGRDPLPLRLAYVVLTILTLCNVPEHLFQYDTIDIIINGTRWTFVISYIVMWAIIPEARTIEDRLKMEGKRVDSDNIKQAVFNEHEKTTVVPQQRSALNGCLSGIIAILVFFLKVFGILIAGILGIIVITTLCGFLFFHSCHLENFTLSWIPSYFSNHVSISRCSAPDITTEVNLFNKEFSTIEFHGVGDIIYTQGDEFKLVADGDSCYVVNAKASIDDGCLRIEDSTDYNDRQIHGSIRFFVTAPSIKGIRHSGIGQIQMPDSVKLDCNFTIECKGVGGADIRYIESPSIDARLTDVGDMTLCVETQELNIRNTGVGQINLSGHAVHYNELEVSEFTATVNNDALKVDF